jgi:SAM-dependent methyltransferase
MAHLAQKQFVLSVKNKFPQFFKEVSVLDIGSLDINGNNRYAFEDYTYIGVDLGPGKNVDVICPGHEYQSDTLFDHVISTECFEHDMYYDQTIKNCVELTKPGGMFLFTCASTGRAEHGTRRTSPNNAPLLEGWGEWGDYYKNLTEDDIREVIDVDSIFSEYYFLYHSGHKDLFFYGIKNNL